MTDPGRDATTVARPVRPVRRPPAASARPRRVAGIVVALVAAVQLALLSGPAGATLSTARAAAADRATILLGQADSLDPARQGDIESAAVSAQLFETLTAIDAGLQTRPALAASWEFRDDGTTVVFHLRPNLTFSDGSPLTAADVVRSWLRIVDPANPSPLVSLMGDVSGALAHAHGDATDPASVGLSAQGDDVVVRLTRPASDFPTIVASPTFGIVPPDIDTGGNGFQPGDRFVGSGGYTLVSDDPTMTTLAANPHYWAGAPAIRTIDLLHDVGGRSPVTAFESGDVDLADVSSFDASWLAYDATLGPQLRRSDGLALRYYGFDTSRPPFDDVRVRQAFARAVDWRRLIALTSTGASTPATGMVPPGVPGRTDKDFLPPHDPAGARALLAAAGYPEGRGFPVTVLLGGGAEDRAFVAEIQRELGVAIRVEVQNDGFFERLQADPPQIFSMGWVADYPGPNDFLGILLGSGASNNYGRWSSSEFDAAIGQAQAARDPAAARAAFDAAEGIVRDEAPTIPLTYDVEWSLARRGLQGAYANGLGIIRMAGLAWDR
jgi:oligopeptide transport system substrate-binding protein